MASDEAGAERLTRGGVPVFADPAQALRSLRHLVEYGRQGGHAAAPPPLSAQARERVNGLLARARDLSSPVVGEADLQTLLKDVGIPVPRHERVTGAEAAGDAFDRLGGTRVVIKIDSEDIHHKSDIGGVRVGIASRTEAGKAADEVLQAVRSRAPDARIRGLIMSEMIDDGVEVVVGAQRDPALGPFVMVGLGGVFVEVLKDVAFR